MTLTVTAHYSVEGMTCSHCRAAVIERVGEIPGISEVQVDLESGHLEVRGAAVDDAAVEAAVDEAGYRVVAKGP